MDNAGSLPERGKTWFDGSTPPTSYSETVDLEGALRRFDDLDSTTGVASSQARLSGRQVICRLVRNASGIALLPKRVVAWSAGFHGRRLSGYATVDHQETAGVVDSFYPAAGIANNDLGWIVVSGPALVLTSLAGDAENVITEGDTITALTGATTGATTAGRMQKYVVTSNATLGTQAALNHIGRAMSAKTTAQTNGDCLVDLEIIRAA